jgi:hypothetical protein
MGVSPMQHRRDADATAYAAFGTLLWVPPTSPRECDLRVDEIEPGHCLAATGRASALWEEGYGELNLQRASAKQSQKAVVSSQLSVGRAIMQNEANLDRDRGSGAGGQRPDARCPTPEVFRAKRTQFGGGKCAKRTQFGPVGGSPGGSDVRNKANLPARVRLADLLLSPGDGAGTIRAKADRCGKDLP